MTDQIDPSTLIQLPGGQMVSAGVHVLDDCVFGIGQFPRLIAIAQPEDGVDVSAASTAIEIFLDDMQTNLGEHSETVVQTEDKNFAKTCMQESFDNINEYLNRQARAKQVSDSDQLVAITALHIGSNYFHYYTIGCFGCYLSSGGKILNLGHKSEERFEILGANPEFSSSVQTQDIYQDDLILVGRNSEIESVGLDFIRMTLSRFPDELDVVIRQLNTRALHSGLKHPPGWIIAKSQSKSAIKTGWFGKSKD